MCDNAIFSKVLKEMRTRKVFEKTISQNFIKLLYKLTSFSAETHWFWLQSGAFWKFNNLAQKANQLISIWQKLGIVIKNLLFKIFFQSQVFNLP